jgi:UDP-glucose 4-epimerase
VENLSERRVFVSGAAGYIGGAVAGVLAQAGLAVTGGVRRAAALPGGVKMAVTGDLANAAPDLGGFDCVVHAAGLGHRRGVTEAVWRRANIDAAANLARAAKAAGVNKFVLVSTAHVYGRVHMGIVTDATAPNPMDDYAASKLEAETRVAEIFEAGLTVLRPVAVIGPHCPGNLQLVMKLLARQVPLPFGAIANRRSFIEAGDLARLVLAALRAETPPSVLLAAHPEAISTPDLVRALARGMAVKPNLLAFPPGFLRLAAGAAGRGAMWQSLAGSFVADPQNASALGWAPQENLAESLARTGVAYVVT